MKTIANGLVAKLMDEFIDDIVDNCDDEMLADMLQNSWLTYGVPDESGLADCFDLYDDDESYNDLKDTFIKLLKIANVEYSAFRDYVNYIINEQFLPMIENCLTKE